VASEPIRSTAITAAPKDYPIPNAQQIRLLSVTAEFIDNGAAGDWLPAVVILDKNGNALCRAVDQGVKVTAGGDAEVSWFPGVKVAPATTPTPAGAGLVVANLYQSGFGPTYPATGGHVFCFDTTYAGPQSDSTDTSVLDTNTTTAFNGKPVWGIVVNAVGTYAFYATWNVRATDPGVTSALLSWDTTGGVGPSTFFQGRYGADPHDTWENTATGVGTGELFLHQWFLARVGQPPFFVTTETIIQGAGNVIANPSIYAVQLSPTALSAIT
jgi:hypothetical protein